ncbi:hypothetical protein TraAM80_07089 [Trypanosoma rangeli]|uniref:Uncharacterized protein n=1 Tax=Trypanosoma rangeli TaxID=5698 RepID=A0A422N736_TRYRA|nr:uncharacterized protein TraAM80_07089 [Trypanosoma rangeli]RNF01288.1 hypothetical protein TraAM80_07089 [Trypanosoma rangeli]|eukprot:RNF01288.1 hypothetical protein TraAM80_07089 [Trypanosoma rangeli]
MDKAGPECQTREAVDFVVASVGNRPCFEVKDFSVGGEVVLCVPDLSLAEGCSTVCVEAEGESVIDLYSEGCDDFRRHMIEQVGGDLLGVEAELHEFSESLVKLGELIRDGRIPHRQQELVEMYVGCVENGDDARDLVMELQMLVQEHKRLVGVMRENLMELGAREKLLLLRLDGVGEDLACAGKGCLAVDGKNEEEQQRRVLEEMQLKHQNLSDALLFAGNEMRMLQALQQRRDECLLRTLQEHAPLFMTTPLRNAGFMSNELETGIFFMAGGVFLSVVFGTLMYKRYSLI